MLPAAVFAGLPAFMTRRWSARTAVVASAVARLLVVEAIALIAYAEAPFALLLILAALFEIAAGLHQSARGELVLQSARVPGDLAALASSGIVTSIGLMAGALVSVVVVVTVPLDAAFAIVGLAFVPLVVMALRLPVGSGPFDEYATPNGRPDLMPRLLNATRAISGQPWMRLRIALSAAAFLVEATLDLMLVVIALELLHVGDGGVGWLRAAFACGGLLVAAINGIVFRSGRLALATASGLALAGLPLVVIAAWPATVPALFLIVSLGAGYALLQASLTLLTRRLVSAETVTNARIVEQYVYPLARAVGAGVGAWLVVRLGDSSAVLVAGLLLPVVAVLGLGPLRRAEANVRIPPRALTLISELPLLAALPPAAIENLAHSARLEKFAAGTTILRPDRANDRLFVIDDGSVECADGRWSTERLATGACFGQSAILADHNHDSTVTALSPVTTWTITRTDFIGSLGGPARTTVQPATEDTSAVAADAVSS
jgi:hypothetical protein